MSRGRKRCVAGRDEILATARAIGAHEGWKAVTIRSVGQALGYSSPLLYEHFKDKEDLLTQIAVEGLRQLKAKLTAKLPSDPQAACLTMVERYWTFMLEHTQLYRLMNGMDGAPIDRTVVGQSAQSLCKLVEEAVRPLMGENASEGERQELADELWALLHGMAALYLDRFAPFELERVTNAAMRLISGARMRTGLRPVAVTTSKP
jgi:AcrR family transcriptional regulator